MILKNRKDDKVYELMKQRYGIPFRLINTLKQIKPKIKQEDKKQNLFICGKTGTGKTIYTLGIAYGLLKDIRRPIMYDTLAFVNISDLLIQIKQSYKKSQQDPNYGIVKDPESGNVTTFEERLMNKCKHAKCLIFDDFGTGKSTDWTDEILFSIINHRYNNEGKGECTLVTSNFKPNELSKKMDDRIVSRLLDMCDVVVFKKQYRKL